MRPQLLFSTTGKRGARVIVRSYWGCPSCCEREHSRASQASCKKGRHGSWCPRCAVHERRARSAVSPTRTCPPAFHPAAPAPPFHQVPPAQPFQAPLPPPPTGAAPDYSQVARDVVAAFSPARWAGAGQRALLVDWCSLVVLVLPDLLWYWLVCECCNLLWFAEVPNNLLCPRTAVRPP